MPSGALRTEPPDGIPDPTRTTREASTWQPCTSTRRLVGSPRTTRPAVDGITLDIADGEFLVLVGPSGCGKSTTLRMLAGLEPIDGGRILVDGHDQKGVRPRDRDIAMVFQSYALYPNMTAAQNMAFALDNAKVSKSETRQRVAEAAKILELEQLLDRKPGQMSGGQRQRVAMGRAIVRNPKVFCMDEPLSNLDAKLRVSTRSQIAGLQRRLGITTVYVTHDQVEAMTMGHRVAVLRDGRLQQVDTPERALRPPGQHLRRGVHRVAGDHARGVRGPRGRRRACTASRVPLDRAVAGRAGEKVVVGPAPRVVARRGDARARPDATSASALNVELVESLGLGVVRLRPPGRRRRGCAIASRSASTSAPTSRSVTSCTSSPTVARCTSSTPRRASGSRPEMSARPGPWASGRFDVEGHRGAKGLVVENTLASFAAAYDAGVTGVELDVRLTADGEVVVWHDAVLLPEKCLADRAATSSGPGSPT